MKPRIALVALVAISALGLGGCKEQPQVLAALNTVQQVITLAQTDVPSLVVAGTITQADATAISTWLGAASSLDAQGITCVTALGASGSASAIATCVNTIGTGLLSPTEMAQLRIISAKAQHSLAIYVTAVVLGVNAAAEIVNAIQTATPTVGASPTTELVNPAEVHATLVRSGVAGDALRCAERMGY
jgi:hypothetical protein